MAEGNSYKMTFKQIGEVVKEGRKKMTLKTQAEAAQYCGLSLKTYQNIEQGREGPGMKSYKKVANKLKVYFSIDFFPESPL